MRFTSTRGKNTDVSFSHAVLDAMPQDGGLYIPQGTEDMRRWVLYTNEHTSFCSMAGALTCAFIHDEFSPIICEAIVTRAFPFEPKLTKLDNATYLLDLSTGPTGYHRDFGISYLVSCIETICTLQGREKSVLLLDAVRPGLLPCLARCLKGAKFVKAVVVCPKGQVKGITQSDIIGYGGNILPVEVKETTSTAHSIQNSAQEASCHQLVDDVFLDRQFVADMSLTMSNTTNIGRLLPQTFFYPFAFSRIKAHSSGEIYYALAPGNYSNVVAGLYSWQFALPLNGFFVPATDYITLDAMGSPLLPNSIVPLDKRPPARPSYPSNAERLEDVFSACSRMIRNFIFPVTLNDSMIDAAAKELYMKYGILTDKHTAKAYSALKVCREKEIASVEDGGAAVLINRDNCAFSSEYIKHTTGETVKLPDTLLQQSQPCGTPCPQAESAEELKSIIASIAQQC